MCFKFEAIQRQELPSKIDDFSTFLGKLAYQLIFNNLIEEGHLLRERDGSVASLVVPEVNTYLTLHIHAGQSHFQFQVHYLAPLSVLPFGPQNVCVTVDTKDVAKMLPATVLAAPMLSRKSLCLIVAPQQARPTLLCKAHAIVTHILHYHYIIVLFCCLMNNEKCVVTIYNTTA